MWPCGRQSQAECRGVIPPMIPSEAHGVCVVSPGSELPAVWVRWAGSQPGLVQEGGALSALSRAPGHPLRHHARSQGTPSSWPRGCLACRSRGAPRAPHRWGRSPAGFRPCRQLCSGSTTPWLGLAAAASPTLGGWLCGAPPQHPTSVWGPSPRHRGPASSPGGLRTCRDPQKTCSGSRLWSVCL